MTRILTPSLARFIATLGTLAVMLDVSVVAQSPIRSLPAFDLLAGDGSAVSSLALSQPEHWLLVVAQRPCPRCEAALAALATTTEPGKMVIVWPGASVVELNAMRARHSQLGAAAWYRDEHRAVLSTLGVNGAPVVMGMSGNRIFWTRNLAAMSAGDIESLVKSWIQQQ